MVRHYGIHQLSSIYFYTLCLLFITTRLSVKRLSTFPFFFILGVPATSFFCFPCVYTINQSFWFHSALVWLVGYYSHFLVTIDVHTTSWFPITIHLNIIYITFHNQIYSTLLSHLIIKTNSTNY